MSKFGLRALLVTGLLSVVAGGVAVGSSATASRAAATPSALAQAQADVALELKGLYHAPVGTTPAQKGKNVWIVDCGAVVPGCAQPTDGAVAAGKALGWKVTVADGKITPAGYLAALSQAAAAKPDGIIAIAIDCSQAKAAYQKIHDANIPLIGVYAFDCSDPSVGGSSLFTAEINAGFGATNAGTAKYFQLWGKVHADYLIAATKGQAKVVAFNHPGFLLQSNQEKGFLDEMAKCKTCKVVANVAIAITQLATVAPQIVGATLQKHPEANAVYFPSDTLVGVSAQVLRRAQATQHRVMVGGEGYPNTQALVQDGTLGALAGDPAAWLGWCGASALNEVLAKAPITDCGISFQLITKANLNSVAAKGGTEQWQPTINFQGAFTKTWNK